MAPIPRNVPFPPRARRTFYLDTFTTLNNVGALGASSTFNCSQVPTISATVPNFSEYFAGNPLFGASGGLYSAYRTRGTSVMVEIDNLDTAVSYRLTAGFTQEPLATNGAITAANQNRFSSNPDFRTTTVGVAAGQSRAMLSVSSTIRKLFGANVFVNNDTYSHYALTASTTQAPTTPMFFIVMVLGTGAMTNGVAMRLRFSFDIEAYSRNDLSS